MVGSSFLVLFFIHYNMLLSHNQEHWSFGGSLAEFASADAKKVGIIFRRSMYVAKNTSHGADCASEASAGSGVRSFSNRNPAKRL
jgi:hypothetical protein